MGRELDNKREGKKGRGIKREKNVSEKEKELKKSMEIERFRKGGRERLSHKMNKAALEITGEERR